MSEFTLDPHLLDNKYYYVLLPLITHEKGKASPMSDSARWEVPVRDNTYSGPSTE